MSNCVTHVHTKNANSLPPNWGGGGGGGGLKRNTDAFSKIEYIAIPYSNCSSSV